MDNENRKEDKRGIFLGIVGVLTLIVAIILKVNKKEK